MGNVCCTPLREPPPPSSACAKADESTAFVEEAAGLPPPYAGTFPALPQGWVVPHNGNTLRIVCAASTMRASRAMRNDTNDDAAELDVRFVASTITGFEVEAWNKPGKASFNIGSPLKCVLPSQIPGFISILETDTDATPFELAELARMMRALFDDKKLPEAVELTARS